jgi:serine/threonine-protein kinase
MEQEYKRCNIYIEIGNFYKKVISAQVEGTDANMYSEYWNNLCTLKALNDENPDRDLITLRLYEEIITRSMEYGKYLKEDGISKEEIEGMYNEISIDMTQIGNNSTDKVNEEIDSIRNLLGQAELMLRSNYREVSIQ